jgi:F0F1-type ATP synthase alpha subunit
LPKLNTRTEYELTTQAYRFPAAQPMPDQTLSLVDELRRALGGVHWQVRQQEVGWIDRVGDGVAYLRGARSVRYAELLETADGRTALAFDIQPQEVGALFLDPADRIRAGDEMRLTGRVASTARADPR